MFRALLSNKILIKCRLISIPIYLDLNYFSIYKAILPPEINFQDCRQNSSTPAKADGFTGQAFQMCPDRQIMSFDIDWSRIMMSDESFA